MAVRSYNVTLPLLTPRKQAPPLKKALLPQSDDNKKAEAVIVLRHFLLSKYIAGELAATEVAELGYIDKCGLPGFNDIAWRMQDDNFEKHESRMIKRATSIDALEKQLYTAIVPICQDNVRKMYPMKFFPIHEVLMATLNHRVVLNQVGLSDNFLTHSVRREAVSSGHLPVAYGHFADAATWKGKGPGSVDSARTPVYSNNGSRFQGCDCMHVYTLTHAHTHFNVPRSMHAGLRWQARFC